MKNYFSTLAVLIAFAFYSNAQEIQNAKTSTIEINKLPQPCVVAEYPIAADMVEGALRKKFADAKLGSGDKTKDGFRVYKGIVIPEITKERIDVYFKVEDKKPMSTVYMLTSKGYDNFMKMDPDSTAVNNTITYLNAFIKDATAYLLNNQIAQQNEVIKGVEKKSRKAAKDGECLMKDKAKTESKISRSAIELSAMKAEMEKSTIGTRNSKNQNCYD